MSDERGFWKFFGLLVAVPLTIGLLWLLWIVIRLIHWQIFVA